jgi:hypothetical protein
MKIYVGHSTGFDFASDLYAPLKQSPLWSKHQIYLPHENSKDVINTRNIIVNSDIFIADVSYPSTGLGIELGWANQAGVMIVCLAQMNAKLSSSLQIISSEFIRYVDEIDMMQKLCHWFDETTSCTTDS